MRSLTTRIAFTICLLVPTLAIADSPGPNLNPYRAYPPSCLALPLPAPSGPGTSTQVVLPLSDGTGSETVNFAVWRTPCSGGTSALLGAFGRTAQNAGAVPAPVFPSFSISQGSSSITASRVAPEPNTIISDIPGGVAFFGTFYGFVFENWPYADQPQFNFSQALSITFNQAMGYPPVVINVPAYDPTQYASASLPMQISGYQTGNYSDPSGRQGIQIEVVESSTPGQRYVVLAWYTYDNTGTAYWLFNSGSINVGDRSASFPLGYFSGGGFAGSGNGNVSAAEWGTISISFPDCDHMTMSYQALTGLPPSVPAGSGTRTFTRTTSINGATCDSP